MLEPDAVEDGVGVRHPRERGAGGVADRVPELLGDQAGSGEDDGGTGEQVGIEDGQAVGVVQGQTLDGSLVRTEPEELHDLRGVGVEGG
ncbi:hypothetical protein SFUMM280S_06115 [Streptomyces fumanus]